MQRCMDMGSVVVIPAGTQVILISDSYLEGDVEWEVVSLKFPCFSSSLSVCWSHMP